MLKIIKNNKGVVLLMTLSFIAILLPAAFELNRKTRNSMMTTASARDRVTLSHIASSGVHAAMAMLIKDRKSGPPSGLDSVQEDWADPEKIAETLESIRFEAGSVNFKITDERSRIQVNAMVQFPKGREFNPAQQGMWDRMARALKAQSEQLEEVEPTTIVNSIKDWLDSGDDDAVTGLSGAESDYYEDLDPPVKCKNGPITHIDEMLSIKGMKRELFYGLEGILPGLSDFLTVHCMTKSPKKVKKREFTFDGKININTADLPVLMAVVSSEDPEYAQAIYDYREEKEDGKFVNTNLSSLNWYKEAPGCGDLAIANELITTSSDFFRIESTASLNNMKLTAIVVVFREKNKKTGKWRCKVLSWDTE
ncbi:general secretion pathway protein GspK [Desulfobacterales bacterium HSG16]|nr:general secretion pathway protein GspK [Desulfobacterales bacterium HSG16]